MQQALIKEPSGGFEDYFAPRCLFGRPPRPGVELEDALAIAESIEL